MQQRQGRVNELEFQVRHLMQQLANSQDKNARLKEDFVKLQHDTAQQLAAVVAQLRQLMALAAGQQAEIKRLKQNARPATQPAG